MTGDSPTPTHVCQCCAQILSRVLAVFTSFVCSGENMLIHAKFRPTGRAISRQLSRHPQIYLINPLNPELNPICYLLALLGAHHFLRVSRIRVKLLTFRRLMSYIYIYIYIYGAPILDVSRSHTTTQHSR